jgi:drug/metabolite transporter (DMT)-like permease
MGEIYALSCSLIWSFAVILLQRSGERVAPLALNLFRSSVSVLLLLPTLFLAGQSLRQPAPLRDYLLLIASGILGIAFADTLFHASLNRIGSGLSAIASTTYSPLIVLMAYFMLGERVRLLDLFGMGLIMSGMLLTGSLHPPQGRTRRQLVVGIFFGVADMVLLAFAIVLVKPVLNHSAILWATTVRQIGSLVVLLLMALISRQRRAHFAVYRPARSWRTMVPAAALGSYLSLILWIASMKYSLASIAAILTQTSTIFILILAAIFLHEPFPRRKLVAAALAVAGVLFITIL